MQLKNFPSGSTGVVAYKANRQLIQASKKAVLEGQVTSSNKELVVAASKIQVTRKETVKPGHVPFQERIPTLPPAEEAAKQFNICYLEQQQSQPGSQAVSCYRSTGAVPIPRRASAVVNTYKPPPQRKTSMPEPFKTAFSFTLEPLKEEQIGVLCQGSVTAATDMVTFSTVSGVGATEVATQVDHPEVAEAPKPVLPTCIKHSKCHCHLFSLKVDGFYNVSN